MRINIRKGVFETNSSSCHSICIVKQNNLSNNDTWPHRAYYDDDSSGSRKPSYKITYWHSHTYSRSPFEILHTWVDKALYYLSDRLTWANDKSFIDQVIQEVSDVIRKRYPEFDGFDDILDRDGCFKGTVDHQSLGLAERVVNTIGLEEFLFNDKVVVIIDGDEYMVLYDLMTSGLLNVSNIEKEIDSWVTESTSTETQE